MFRGDAACVSPEGSDQSEWVKQPQSPPLLLWCELSEGNHWITFRWLQFVCLAVTKVIPTGHSLSNTAEDTFVLFSLTFCCFILSGRQTQVCAGVHTAQTAVWWSVIDKAPGASHFPAYTPGHLPCCTSPSFSNLVRQLKILGRFL